MGKTKKYPKPRAVRLDQKKVSSFLKSIEFEASEIRQEWRHLIAFGEYKNRDCVFKLATTKKTSSYTQNEYYWNEVIAEYSSKKDLSFRVPTNYSKGFYKDGLFYLINDWFKNKTMAETGIWPVEMIAQMAFEIISMPEPSLKRETKRQKQSAATKLVEPSIEWASQVKNYDTKPFLKIVKDAESWIREAPAHGDFTVRQMFVLTDGEIGIIDGEHYGQHGLRYYDPAWFYLRMRLEQKDLNSAKKFLLELKKLLNKNDQNIFWKELKPVLIQRFIGHLWGARDRDEELAKLDPIGKDILNNEII